MQHQSLHHMYQAWLQGNETYVIDYKNFITYAATMNNMSYDDMFILLRTYRWFQYIDE